MPPKKAAAAAPSKKTEQKKKEKVIEDKTFGLKNKKGGKQQKFIQQVQKQVQSGGPRKADAAKAADKKKLEDDPLMSTLFKPVTQAQKIEKGADPKSVLCAFFKSGQCGKGNKCKFSHDLTIERKAEKRSLYSDGKEEDEKADTMEEWDEEKLKEVVEKKHGATNKTKPQTDIICKFFLDAVEKAKYGWFWACPNGEDCHYRHALPPGFVLKRDKIKDAAKKDEISLEDLIEKERQALGSNLTKVTLESFVAWKKRKIQERKEALRRDEDKKRADFKAGRQVGLSGREMFTFNPLMADDGDMEEGDETFDTRNLVNEDEQDENEYKEIVLDDLEFSAQDVDDSGTQATSDRLQQLKLDSDVPGGSGDGANGTDVPIDEDLFNDDSDLPDSEDDVD